jgi:hypothetical protein
MGDDGADADDASGDAVGRTPVAARSLASERALALGDGATLADSRDDHGRRIANAAAKATNASSHALARHAPRGLLAWLGSVGCVIARVSDQGAYRQAMTRVDGPCTIHRAHVVILVDVRDLAGARECAPRTA